MKISEVVAPQIPMELFHATPLRRYQRIKIEGLVPSAASHPGQPPGIYLADAIDGAATYAHMNFGEDEIHPWVVLRVDGNALDPSKLVADCGQEIEGHMDEIQALGYSAKQVYAGQIPWWVSLQFSGQVIYRGNIAPNHLRIVQTIR